MVVLTENNFVQAKDVIDTIYKDKDGFAISEHAIKTNPFYYVGMVYGEVSTLSFLHILSLAKPQKGEIFYDLGSGVGKKVIASAHTFPFARCTGIELVKDLYHASEEALRKYHELFPAQADIVQFFCKDFNQHNFLDGDIFFLSLTAMAMEIELYGRLQSRLEKLKKGARFITTDIPFISPSFDYEESFTAEFGRSDQGKAMFYIHTKKV